MRRMLVIFAAALATVALAASAALAASPHFKKGGAPTCNVSAISGGSETICSATLAGLGNSDVQVDLSVSGFALYQCQNGGGNIAPGQNKVLVGPATSSTSFPASSIKNGNLSITTNPADLTAPATVSGATAGCPNSNWTGVNPVVTPTSITLVISQPPGTVIFRCTASNPKGLSGTVPLSC